MIVDLHWLRVHLHSIKAVRQINLQEVAGALGLRCFQNGAKYSFEGLAELHGFTVGYAFGVLIDFRKGVVNDEARSTLSLGDYAEW